jgi:hypothetical protein
MPNLFEGHLIRLRGFEPEDWEIHHWWDNAGTFADRMTDEQSMGRRSQREAGHQ